MWNAAGKLDDFQPALDVAFGVGKDFAVLGREQPRQGVGFLLRQFEEFHQHAGAPLRVGRRPGRLSGFRHSDRMLDFGVLG